MYVILRLDECSWVFFAPRPYWWFAIHSLVTDVCNRCSASWTWWALPLALAPVVVSVAWLQDGCVDSWLHWVCWVDSRLIYRVPALEKLFQVQVPIWYQVWHLHEVFVISPRTEGEKLEWMSKTQQVLGSCQGHRLSGAFAAVRNPGVLGARAVYFPLAMSREICD